MRKTPPKLDLRSLRYVLAIAECGSLARAATTLGVTQSALSRSIQALERSLGARIFDRGKGGALPTAHGRLLLEQGRQLLADARAIERDIRLLGSVEMGALAVGAGAYAADISVGSAAGRMVAAHPGVRLRVSIADWPELVRRVLAEEIDLAVCETASVEGDERLRVELLPEHPAVFFCRREHPLAKSRSLDLADIQDYPLALTSLPPRLVALIRGRGQPIEGAYVPQVHVDTFTLARQIVLASDAIGVAAKLQVAQDVSARRAVVLPLELPWFRSRYGFIHLARRTPSPSAKAFMEIVRTIEGELAKAG